jgi:hypothetical protein
MIFVRVKLFEMMAVWLIQLTHYIPPFLLSPNTSPRIIFIAMPPRTNTTSNPASDRPQTRSKNANVHPGTAAQEALRVNAPRRDPAVIQKERDAVKERKALKVQEKEANQARDEATKRIADEFRAQQVSKQASDEAEMPRKMSNGRVHCPLSMLDIPSPDLYFSYQKNICKRLGHWQRTQK